MPRQSSRWFPTTQQLRDPVALERTLRQVLTQHYALQDRFNSMVAEKGKPGEFSGPPPGSGPTDTMLLGLRVLPVDANRLADGAKLTWVKAAGHFEVK